MRTRPRMHANKKELLALGVFGRGSRIGERIAMLLNRGRELSPRASRSRAAAGAAALAICLAAAAFAPAWIAFAQEPLRFEVASVRPNQPDLPFMIGPMRITPTGIEFSSDYLTGIVGEAYQVPYSRIAGGDARISQLLRGTYDISAKADHAVSKDQLRAMLQTLLVARFKMSVRRESRTEPVYKLVIGKNGAKLKVAEGTEAAPYMAPLDGGGRTFHNYTMARFCAVLSNYLGRAVLDETGLAGVYQDFTLKVEGIQPINKLTQTGESWAQSTIFADIEPRLGLKLESARGAVEYLVIDHLEKPEEN